MATKAPKLIRLPLGTGEVDNDVRADWADDALSAFAYLTHQDTSGDLEHDKRSVVGDLLANLMYLCERDGIDFEGVLLTAQMHYEEEKDEE